MANYNIPMDDSYIGPIEKPQAADVEEPLFPLHTVGQSVTEGGRFGNLLQTAQGAIRMGAGSIELQTGMGGGAEPVGAEAYGREARQAFREMAKVNEVTFTSVHTPTQIGNLSGLTQQGFSDEARKQGLDEVKKAIRFAADVTQGGAVVVHTGEFQRTMFDADWNTREGDKWKDAFIANDEEPERATVFLVDQRTGKLVSEIRRNQVIHRPEWNRSPNDYAYTADEIDEKKSEGRIKAGQTVSVKTGDYVDYEGRLLDVESRVPTWDTEKNEFKIQPYDWDRCIEDAKEMNDFYGYKKGDKSYITPEEAAFRMQLNSRIAIAKGWKLNYGRDLENEMKLLKDLKKQLEFYQKLEKEVPEEDLWKLKKEAADRLAGAYVGEFAPPAEYKLPSEIIKDGIHKLRQGIDSHKEMVVGQMQEIAEQQRMIDSVKSINKYAKEKSISSYADAGLFAMRESRGEHVERDIFVAPENIFPNMGYGSHPDELLEIVTNARNEMADRLSKPYAPVKSGRIIQDDKRAEELNKKWGTKLHRGDIEIDANPDFQGISHDKAMDIAKRHIKATWDTQHMGMWWEHFKPLKDETESQRRERFNEWFKEKSKMLADADIIGNVHLVDSVGGGHHHLPMGQGDLPLTDAMTYLKKKGYLGSITSEGHGEETFGTQGGGQGRILLQTWKALGSPIYSMGSVGAALAGPRTWGDVHQGYFGRTYPPNFMFAPYAPSEEFKLWTDVLME